MTLEWKSPKEKIGRHITGSLEQEGFAHFKKKSDEWEQSHPEQATFVKELLKGIDLKKMHEIFLEDARRAEGDSTHLNYIPPDRILFTSQETSFQSADSNFIAIDAESPPLMWLYQRKNLEALHSDVKDEAINNICVFLKEVVHENVHAHGFQQVTNLTTYPTTDNPNLRIDSVQNAGFAHYSNVIEGSSQENIKRNAQREMYFWNEGFTEWYAIHIAREYLRRNPFEWRGIQVNTVEFDAHAPVLFARSGYNFATYMINEFAKLVANDQGVPKEVVEKGLIRAYLSESGRVALIEAFQALWDEETVVRMRQLSKDDATKPEAITKIFDAYLRDHPEILDRAWLPKTGVETKTQ